MAHAKIQPSTLATLRALDTSKLEWLGNVPIDALVALRKDNENEDFRRQLDGFTKNLSAAALDNIDRVAAEVGRGIASMMVDHAKKARAIKAKYQKMHWQSAGAGWLTLCATLVPTLAPFLPVAGSAGLAVTALKYGRDKWNQRSEKAELARSLMGVLASAKETA